ncbi:integrase-like protein [Paenibacillus sp. BK033]|uniref:Mu transposase C-terminal domain-containing protein n=1 Tax=Paenibacillus sp. BK033 TaxID=2512133 RepID=UPI00104F82D7|nr:Mu transposase C-terminal domain-containing protein [Paenibacillus sp. BK033]TCM99451.1 integrase-like protein [Paenibacillus sp. BK033]
MRGSMLRIDDEFEWCGSKFHVHDFEHPNVLIFKEDGDRKIVKVQYLSIITDPTFRIVNREMSLAKAREEKDESNRRALIDTLSEAQQQTAKLKMSIIDPILTFNEVREGNLYAAQLFKEKYMEFLLESESLDSIKKVELIKRVAEKYDYTSRQIYRMLDKYKTAEAIRDNHGIEGLVSKAHLKIHNRKDEIAIPIAHPKNPEIILDTIYIRLPEGYAPVIKRELDKFIIRKRRKFNILKDELEISCTANNLPPLDYDTVYKLANRIDKYVFERINKGDVVEPKLVQEKASNQFAKAPLHVIEIDHVQLPITLIDPETGVELGEPILSLGLCAFSRNVWGMELSYDHPSGDKVMRLLFNGICFKDAKAKYGTLNDWDMHGIPTVILMDNGSDFTSTYVKYMIEDVLKAEPRYRPIATPRYGGIIERNFGTINTDFLQKLLGTRVKSEHDRDAKKEARLTAVLSLDNLRELLVGYITDIYHQQEHSGLPLDCNTPAARLYTALDVMGSLPFIPKEDEPYYKLQLLPTDMRSYRRDGIRVENVKYGSPETTRFISNKQKKNCKIKYDLDDISHIYLLDPKEAKYIEVPSISPPADEIKGMNRKQYEMLRKCLIEAGELTKQQIPGYSLISKGKLLIREKFNKMVSTNISARKRALKQGFELQVKDKNQSAKQSNQKPMSKVQQFAARLNEEKAKKKQQN